jgi:hypothetical protein
MLRGKEILSFFRRLSWLFDLILIIKSERMIAIFDILVFVSTDVIQ